MPCYGVLGGCAPTTPFFNIKKIALFMYSGNFPNGSCPPDCSCCDDVWDADLCGFAYDPDGGCTGGQEGFIKCGGFANAVAWLNSQASAFQDDGSYPWNQQRTVIFNSSTSTAPDCSWTGDITGLLDFNGSYWSVAVGGDGCCDGCVNDCYDTPNPTACNSEDKTVSGGCLVLTGQMMAIQIGGSLWVSYSAYSQNPNQEEGCNCNPCLSNSACSCYTGPGCVCNLDPSVSCSEPGGCVQTCLALGTGDCVACSPSGSDPLLTYYISMPDFGSLCASANSINGIVQAGTCGGCDGNFYPWASLNLALWNSISCCGNGIESCNASGGGSYAACGDDPP